MPSSSTLMEAVLGWIPFFSPCRDEVITLLPSFMKGHKWCCYSSKYTVASVQVRACMHARALYECSGTWINSTTCLVLIMPLTCTHCSQAAFILRYCYFAKQFCKWVYIYNQYFLNEGSVFSPLSNQLTKPMLESLTIVSLKSSIISELRTKQKRHVCSCW